jgi:mannose-6-phosphate isomerase
MYPLKFKTIFKDKLWGGQKIRTVLGKDYGDLPNCGETWELSGVEGNISIISNGKHKGRNLKSLLQSNGPEILGNAIHKKFGDDFPLLIKFIDANQDLSIQVHPDDKLAASRHNSLGKTEMWYVMQADEDSSLISGFSEPLDKEKYLEKFNAGQLAEILNREEVQADDVYFLPAGRVHTIGKGLLIAEIQQTSDITYRIYDFDRVDDLGNKRELHVEQALDAIDYNFYDEYKSTYETKLNERVQIVSCEYFTTNKLNLNRQFDVDLSHLDCFKIYICLAGEASIKLGNTVESVNMGEVVLIPASWKKYTIETIGSVVMLESYIES